MSYHTHFVVCLIGGSFKVIHNIACFSRYTLNITYTAALCNERLNNRNILYGLFVCG